MSLSKLAKQLANKTKPEVYKTGSEDEKVWVNFQTNKKLKREFNDLCKTKSINASSFLRSCIEVLLKKEGDASFLLNDLKSDGS